MDVGLNVFLVLRPLFDIARTFIYQILKLLALMVPFMRQVTMAEKQHYQTSCYAVALRWTKQEDRNVQCNKSKVSQQARMNSLRCNALTGMYFIIKAWQLRKSCSSSVNWRHCSHTKQTNVTVRFLLGRRKIQDPCLR